ncbi:glycosyltransferase family 4 protein [Peribacillus sp. SI8-4]|uniref:glycosyltransferase family 4 protein n=1 Tax=Peribacillus sp. SI8-4 TaxID=3048009 RepID=UPI0025547780|nr:glycosyltransferase family 4 protein [Peribacillus sp. SI8-4]
MANIIMIGPAPEAKGGIATVIKNFSLHFASDEHQISYLSSWERGGIWNVCKVFFRTLKRLSQLIHKESVDIVHIHVAQKGSFFRKALLSRYAQKKGVKVILHIHGSQFDVFYKDAPSLLKRIIRGSLQHADAIVVLSEEWQEFFKELTDTPITVIENAVMIPAENRYNAHAKNIVTFGRLGERKGSYDILDVAKMVFKSNPEINFILYGDGEIKEVSQLIKKRNLSNVTIGGWIGAEEKLDIYPETGLHLLPSYHEGLPMAILETMAYGIPNISTDVGGIPQVIQNEKNGFLVKPGDSKQITLDILDFFSNETYRNDLSKEAYSMIKVKFSMGVYLNKWECLYGQLVSINRGELR